MFKKMQIKLFFVLIAIFILSVSISFLVLGISLQNQGTILEHVKIMGVDVGGLTREEAEKKILENWLLLKKDFLINFSISNQDWIFKANDIHFEVLVKNNVEKAMEIGRTDNWLENIYFYYISLSGEVAISTIEMEFDQVLVEKLLNSPKIQAGIKKLKESELSVENGSITLQEEKEGEKIDFSKVFEKLKTVSYKDFKKKEIKVEVPLLKVKPNITKEDLKGIDTILSNYKTNIEGSVLARKKNIILASKAINKTLLKKDAVFSFNQTVGERSANNGYLQADVISDGKIIKDWGGGVCQVSSTLYNAILLAGLEVKERERHDLPVSYVPLGQDATVVDQKIDFQFKNSFKHSIYILANIQDDFLNIYILGSLQDKKNNVEIINKKNVLQNNVIIEKDYNLQFGEERIEQEGRMGFKVEVYRIFKNEQGNEVFREKISEDEIEPVDKIIKIGAMGNFKN